MEDINKRLEAIEKRLSRIESELATAKKNHTERPVQIVEDDLEEMDFRLIKDNSLLESNIGRYGLAWIGSLVLLLGIIFLNHWILTLGKPVTASLVGYASVAALLIIRQTIRQNHEFLAFMFKLVGFFLLYYFTLRLHYFSSSPIIPGQYTGLALLVLVVLVQLYLGIRQRKEFFSALALLLGYFTGLASDDPVSMLSINVGLALASVYLLMRFAWKRTFVLSLIAGYLVFLFWSFNNPLMGNPLEVITEHHSGTIYLFAYVILLALVPFLHVKRGLNKEFMTGSLWLNSLGFSLVLLILVLQFFSENFAGLFILISVLCLGYAFVLEVRTDWRFGSAFYALYGFLALSIALYGLFKFPTAHLFLALESLLVVSMALWFRNKLIVIMNGILFAVLLVAYFAGKQHLDSVNVAYALVPLLTARILNWKKQRLEIKTDLLRNLYLVIGFVAVLYALQQAVPGKYVSLSWTLTALLYFLISFLLNNVKYRYMALGTVVAAAFYLLLVDLARIEIAYRVIAFLFLALISIGVSVYYSRRIGKQE